MGTKKITLLNELRSLVQQVIKEEISQIYTIKLTSEQLKLLKEALLAAENSRDKMFYGAGKVFADLHMDIDEQT